jgi:hypothetical protein
MTKNARINSKSHAKRVGLKSETENDIRIYQRAQPVKGLFAIKSINYDVCLQFNPHNNTYNVTTVKLRLTESITLTAVRYLTGNDVTGNLTHTKRSLRKAQPTFR